MTLHDPHETVDILALHERARGREVRGRIGSAAAGLVLTGVALFGTRTNSTRAALGTVGCLLIARGLSGLSLQQVGDFARNLFRDRADLERRFHDGEHDVVDAASFDSFPASDPPSYSPG